MKEKGCGKIILKGDREPALVSLMEEVRHRRRLRTNEDNWTKGVDAELAVDVPESDAHNKDADNQVQEVKAELAGIMKM